MPVTEMAHGRSARILYPYLRTSAQNLQALLSGEKYHRSYHRPRPAQNLQVLLLGGKHPLREIYKPFYDTKTQMPNRQKGQIK